MKKLFPTLVSICLLVASVSVIANDAMKKDDMSKPAMSHDQMMKDCMAKQEMKKDGMSKRQMKTVCMGELKKGGMKRDR
jgi:pentapeptide MXKDX repeat protein